MEGPADRLRRHGHHLYVTNLQGDIVGIVDESGSSVASYTYNAWGEIISSSGALAETNPLRYRGYYYDTETNLYYLQSRYYDPGTCRFINADTYAGTGQDFGGYNMFSYCGNNPSSRADDEGGFWSAVVGGAIAGAVVGVASSIIDSVMRGEKITGDAVLHAAVTGALAGAYAGAASLVTLVEKVGLSVLSGVVACIGSLSSGATDNEALAAGATAFIGAFAGSLFPQICGGCGAIVKTVYYGISGFITGATAEAGADIISAGGEMLSQNSSRNSATQTAPTRSKMNAKEQRLAYSWR